MSPPIVADDDDDFLDGERVPASMPSN